MLQLISCNNSAIEKNLAWLAFDIKNHLRCLALRCCTADQGTGTHGNDAEMPPHGEKIQDYFANASANEKV
jgi:hypothetical protein